MLSPRSVIVVAALWSNVALGFAPPRFVAPTDASRLSTARFMSSYSTDASDYASKDSDYVSDDDDGISSFGPGFQESDKFEVTELQPVPMSKTVAADSWLSGGTDSSIQIRMSTFFMRNE